MRKYAPLILIIPLASCATHPEKIKAADIPEAAYAGRTCEDLIAERDAIVTQLEVDEKKQKQAVVGDAVGVFLVGVPVSSALGGDRETDISVAKGKRQAIEKAMQASGC